MAAISTGFINFDAECFNPALVTVIESPLAKTIVALPYAKRAKSNANFLSCFTSSLIGCNSTPDFLTENLINFDGFLDADSALALAASYI
jgi:hypothetical protein